MNLKRHIFPRLFSLMALPLLVAGALCVTLLSTGSVHAQLQPDGSPVNSTKEAMAVFPADFSPSSSLVTEFVQKGIFVSQDALQNGVIDVLESKMVEGGYRVVSRGQLEKILKEQNLAYSGVADPSSAAEAGRVVGAKIALIARVTAKVGTRNLIEKVVTVTIRYQMIDVQTAEIKGVGTVEGKDTIGVLEDALGKGTGQDWESSPFGQALENSAKNLVRKLKDAGDPTKELFNVLKYDDKDSTLIVEAGSDNGIKENDEFEIVREKTVEGLKEITVVGRAIVSVSQNERAKLKVTLTSSEKPKKGDKIRRIIK